MDNNWIKYAAMGLMGVYVYNRSKNSGFGDHYLGALQKSESLIDRLTQNIETDPKVKNAIQTVAKSGARRMIQNHMGVREISGGSE